MIAVFLGLLAALSWSFHDLLARGLAQRVGPYRLALGVMLAGGMLLAGLMSAISGLPALNQQGLLLSVLLGLAYGLGAAGLCKAFSLGPVSIVAPLTSAYPVLVLLWGMFRGLQPTALQWGAAAIALAGAVVVAFASGGPTAALSKGAFGKLLKFSLLSSLGYASSVVLGQYAAVSIGESQAALISRPAAMVMLVPFIASEPRPLTMQTRHWLGIVAMGAFDVLGLVAVNATGHFNDREFAAVGISAYGAIAVLLAMAVFGEKVRAKQWLGILMIAAGVATLSISQ